MLLFTRSLRAALPLVVLAGVLSLPAAQAQTVVFDNGGPGNQGSFFSDVERSAFQSDTFTFAGTTTFNTVEWFGIYSPTNTQTVPDNFTIAFYNTAGGIPATGAAPTATFAVGNAVNRTLNGNTYSYRSLLPSSLSFGTGTYAVSIFNDTTANTVSDWAWTASNLTGAHYTRPSVSGTSQTATGDLAFRLINTPGGAAAPEPGSLALLGLGALPLAGLVVRRRSKTA